MVKHDNYKNPVIITIYKNRDITGNDYYTLRYDDEEWEFDASKEEILEEISEHLELIVLDDEPKHTMLEALSSIDECIDTIAMNELGISKEEVEKIKGE